LEGKRTELQGRESEVAGAEQELEHLRSQVAAFPDELAQATVETEEHIRQTLGVEYEHRQSLQTKEVEGERKLHKQMISSLEAKIAEQKQRIEQLTVNANEAGTQVQNIAVRAIDGAAGMTSRLGEWTAKSSRGEEI